MARFDRTIPPGAEGLISLKVRTKGLHGDIHKKASVITNDPEKPEVTIGLKGKVLVFIHIEPRQVYLAGVPGEEIERGVQLRGEKKEPLALKVASVSIPNKVDVKLKEIEKNRSYELKVKNRAEKVGTYKGLVKLTTNYAEKPVLLIPITSSIKAPIEVTPKNLNFGHISEERLRGGNGNPVRGWVTVRLNKGNGLSIEKVELEKSLYTVVTKEFQPGRVVALQVEPILEKLKKGSNVDYLRIHTNQQGHKALEVLIQMHLEAQ